MKRTKKRLNYNGCRDESVKSGNMQRAVARYKQWNSLKATDHDYFRTTTLETCAHAHTAENTVRARQNPPKEK